MSREGFQGVPGVPDGWELVAIRILKKGEYYLNAECELSQAHCNFCTAWPIVRKIEVPKQYRPFANGLEYVQKRRDWIAVDWKYIDRPDGFYAVVSANDDFVWVAFGKTTEVFNWQQAFERLVCRHIDGSTSPFGVEVISE
jgi:hypothetical protein